MTTIIVTAEEGLGGVIRRTLMGAGRPCPPDNLLRPDRAPAALLAARPELVVLDVGADPEAALAEVGRLRPLAPGRLVAVGGLATPRAILQLIRAGVDDYIDAGDVATELPEIVEALDRRGGGRRAGRVLAVVSPSGGAGASTIAANLALALAAEEKQDVALIDLVPATGSLADLLDLRPAHTLADLAGGHDRPDRDVFERVLVRHDGGVRLLASPRDYEARDRITPELVGRVLELARSRFPYVVLDLDRSLGPEQLEAARGADAVVVAFRQEFNALRDALLALRHLECCGLTPARLHPVATRRGQPREVPAAKAEEALQRRIFHAIPDDPRTILRAANNGTPVLVEARSSRAGRAIAGLARLLRERLEQDAARPDAAA